MPSRATCRWPCCCKPTSPPPETRDRAWSRPSRRIRWCQVKVSPLRVDWAPGFRPPRPAPGPRSCCRRQPGGAGRIPGRQARRDAAPGLRHRRRRDRRRADRARQAAARLTRIQRGGRPQGAASEGSGVRLRTARLLGVIRGHQRPAVGLRPGRGRGLGRQPHGRSVSEAEDHEGGGQRAGRGQPHVGRPCPARRVPRHRLGEHRQHPQPRTDRPGGPLHSYRALDPRDRPHVAPGPLSRPAPHGLRNHRLGTRLHGRSPRGRHPHHRRRDQRPAPTAERTLPRATVDRVPPSSKTGTTVTVGNWITVGNGVTSGRPESSDSGRRGREERPPGPGPLRRVPRRSRPTRLLLPESGWSRRRMRVA
jgi:hypothetical protein